MSDRWEFPVRDSEQEKERAELRARVAQITAAGSGALPLDEALTVLRSDEAPAAVRRAVLTRDDIPAEVVAEARWMPDANVRAYAVSLPGTPVEELSWAASDVAWQVRSEVAGHPSAPVEVLVRLLRDASSVVRRAAIARPEIPVDALVDVVVSGGSRLDAEIIVAMPGFVVEDHVDRLLEADDTGAAAILEHGGVPTALLKRYARADHGARVREAALLRGAPADVAGVALRSAREESVRAAAVRGGKCRPSALARAATTDDSELVRAAVAASPKTPSTAVDALLTDWVESVRMAAARNPNASPETLAVVVGSDESAAVRRAAIGNARCPADAVVAGCRDIDVVFAAAANPACPPEGLFAALVTLRDAERSAPPGLDTDSPSARRAANVARTVKEARRRLAPRAWRFLREQPLTDLDSEDLAALITRHLSEAAVDERPTVRLAVAGHRDVDDATLMMLAADPDEGVRQAVTLRILGAAGGSLTAS